MRCGALVTRLCGAVAAVHCTCGGYDDSCHQARLSAVSDPLVWVCIPIPLSTPSLMFAAHFRVTPDIMDGEGDVDNQFPCGDLRSCLGLRQCIRNQSFSRL